MSDGKKPLFFSGVLFIFGLRTSNFGKKIGLETDNLFYLASGLSVCLHSLKGPCDLLQWYTPILNILTSNKTLLGLWRHYWGSDQLFDEYPHRIFVTVDACVMGCGRCIKAGAFSFFIRGTSLIILACNIWVEDINPHPLLQKNYIIRFLWGPRRPWQLNGVS